MSNLAKRDDKGLSERLGDANGVKKALTNSTTPLKLQRRRTEVEGCRIRVENLVSRFRNRKLNAKQRQELYLECQLMASFGILKGISLLTDMLSHQDDVIIRNEKTGTERRGTRRVTYMEYVWDELSEIKACLNIKFNKEDKENLAEMLGPDAEIPSSMNLIQAFMGLDQKLDNLKDMVHDIGLHHNPKLFEIRDDNDVVITEDRFEDPPEFFEGEDEDDEEPDKVGDEDGEALSDDEAEEIRKKAQAEDDEGGLDDEIEDEEEEGNET